MNLIFLPSGKVINLAQMVYLRPDSQERLTIMFATGTQSGAVNLTLDPDDAKYLLRCFDRMGHDTKALANKLKEPGS